MPATRPTISGTCHAISAGHYLAAAAGFAVLEGGGNAVDAATAAGIALGVLHPDIVSVAGVAPMIIRLADGTVETIAGIGPWPRSIPRDLFREKHGGKMPPGVLRTVARVTRALEVTVTGLDEHGAPVRWTVSGWPARILQHEVDHTRGTLYVDRMDTRTLATNEEVMERIMARGKKD